MRISSSSGSGLTGKIMLTGFGLFFALIGTLFVKQEWKALQDVKAMQQWVQTSCQIETSRTEDDGEDFRLVVSYTYSVNGQTFTGNRIGKNRVLTAETIGEIKRIEKRFPPGKTVQGFYNPSRPADAVLERPTVEEAKHSLGLTIIFPAFGLLFAGLPWMRGRRQKKTENKAISSRLSFILFGSAFSLIGLLMIKPLLADPLQKTQDAKTWNAVPATVVSSKVKSHDSDDGTTYSPYIAYRYVVNGTEYFGDRYTFLGGSSSGYQSKAEIVRRYPEHREITIYVNPENPAESVINRDASWSLLLGLVPLIFFSVGITIIIAGCRTKTGKTPLDRKQAGEHVITLKGKSPVAKASGITLFAGIWCGAVFLICKSDAPILFPIVFGLFGIVIAAGAIHAILAIFNPRPSAEITPGRIHPGTNVALRWRIGGRTERINELTVSLKCLRITTETRRSGGKTSSTVVKTPIHELELMRSSQLHDIAQQAITFTIPADQPPSRPGNRDGIQWQLVFHGDIPRWPDMKEELPFLVYPQETDA